MATNIELAQGGNRRAMETLYEANKQKVYYFATLLGGNAKEAESAAVNAFKVVFGYVTEGMDVVDAVCTSAEPTDDNGTIPTEAQPIITSITIRTEQNEDAASDTDTETDESIELETTEADGE